MKILAVRFKNLNSLKGEWLIDLTHKIYASEGMFAITGPTGAGKTTIFDAICMALYGRTPRLIKIGSKNNEIMTRRTHECFAEVKFESGGQEYKCSWSQKKSAGKLQGARHILSEAKEGGKILSELSRDTVPLIEMLTGLDFKRFTQAMMLEQGRFDAFLKANSTERSEILELITGTEIYSEISTRVYERCQAEYNKREKIKLQLDDKKPRDNLGTNEEIQQELDQNRKMLALIENTRKDMQAAMLWLREIRKLRDELTQNQNDLEYQHRSSENFAPDRSRLEAGLRAQDLMAEHAALEAKRSAFTTTKTRCEKAESEIAAFTERLTQITGKELPGCEAKLAQIRRDVTEAPETVSERVTRLVKIYEDMFRKKQALEAQKRVLSTELAKKQRFMKSAREESEQAREIHEKALNTFRSLLHVRTEAILDGERQRLQPGKPCPVCGSLEHPAIKYSGVMTVNLDDQIREAETRENRAHGNYNRANAAFTQAAQGESKARADLENCINELGRAVDDLADSRAKVLEAIEPLGIYDARSCDEILSRLDKWASGVKALEENIDKLMKGSDLLRSRIQTISRSLTEDKATLEVLTRELGELEAAFRASLTARDFPDEAAFREAQIQPEELAKLQRRANEIDDKIKHFEAVKLDRTQKLEAKLAENLTDSNPEELDERSKRQEESYKANMKRNAELEAALETRKKLQAEYDAVNAEFKIQDKIYSEWAGLNELIGTKNGIKFRNFAQRVTLSMMIGLANRQLEKLNGRYTLTATPGDDGLALSVIDHEQAGEVRPTTNLSGGERFIVSLALALGLSQISGSKARVDSLFLDEGFGSLDEDSLNTALEALGEVRREGRMIGIISHVQALKDRIAAQINVIPKSEGLSILEGPGCKQVK